MIIFKSVVSHGILEISLPAEILPPGDDQVGRGTGQAGPGIDQFQEFVVEENSFQSLSYLDLTGNQLTDMPRPAGSFRNLKVLALYGNPISDTTIEHIRSRFPGVTVKFQ